MTAALALRHSTASPAATPSSASTNGSTGPKKAAKKPRKASSGQKEMLMPIEGKKPKEAAVKKPSARPQRKSA
jgi:DNA end-binding protein Ku